VRGGAWDVFVVTISGVTNHCLPRESFEGFESTTVTHFGDVIYLFTRAWHGKIFP
jgi:hypothetical protein